MSLANVLPRDYQREESWHLATPEFVAALTFRPLWSWR